METAQLSTLLDRSKQSIRCKLHKLRLLRDKITYERSDDVLESLHGATINKIAEKLDVSRQQARAYIKHNNIQTSVRWWTPEEDKIIIDIKAKKFITKEDYYQMQRYLQTANYQLGLIVNFRSVHLKPKRVINYKYNS